MSQGEDDKQNFYVGFSGRQAELEQLLTSGIPLTGVYTGGVTGKIANTHRQYLQDMGLLRRLVEMCHQAGVSIEILIDAVCFGGQHLWIRGQPLFSEYIRQLEEAEIDGVIVSDPVMVELVKSVTDLHITISRSSQVDSISQAKFYEQLGADAIILDPILNRQFERLERVIDVMDHAQPRLLLNEGCLPQCPYRPFHQNLLSHPEMPVANDYYLSNCISMRLEDPSLILRSPMIRPEDLDNYQHLTNHYYLAPRTRRQSTTQSQILKAYTTGQFDGNLLDILAYGGDPLIRIFSIPNRSLDGVWDEKWKSCLSGGYCEDCDYCMELADKVVIDMTARTEQQRSDLWATA